MHARQFLPWTLAALACAMASPVLAGECAPLLKDAWINLPPVSAPTTLAGYGRIENPCDRPAVVVAVQSPAFMHANLHESRVVDGIGQMREVHELPLAAGATVALAQGGLHLMLMHPAAPLKPGDRVAVVLRLQDGRDIKGELTVRKSVP